jgi:hypothetical protein
MREADLDLIEHRDLRPGKGEADRLTVSIWVGRDRRIRGDALPITHAEMA